ncbi:MAG: biosynthetic-type acetolactate synthase large subunit [bacterium]|nr:biosynthetic-type acetolactate synthase large subunit [bacterium]
MARTGADVVVEALLKEGVEVAFGYPGGAILDVFDRLYKAQDKFRFILVRHEQGAAHMADGYARATGKPGVCVVTSGPGATNTVTGIATAYMDSIPMVIISGQVPSYYIGNDAFQEADVTGITRPITKHNYLVKNVKDLPRVMKEAFYIARTGRPGPVLVDIAKDVQKAVCEEPYPETVDLPSYQPKYEGHINQIKKMAEAIKKSKRPVAYVGGGVILSNASEELYTFIKKTRIPVTMTLMGLGAYPSTEPESLHMLGMHGTRYANYAVQESDLLLAIGARFDDRVTGKLDGFAPHATIVHVDIDPTSIAKNVKVHIPVVGDVKDVLTKLNKIVEAPEIEEWRARIAEWKERYPLTYELRDDEIIAQEVIVAIGKLTHGEAIITTDVGQHQMWAAQFLPFTRPRRWITSGGLGTMGFGLPSAIGAQVGFPDQLVINISGDGGIQMVAQELATARINRLPVICVILNNAYLGMVRQWQELFYDKQYAMTCLERTVECALWCGGPGSECPGYIPDFVKLAEAHDCYGQRIRKREEIEPALKGAFERARKERRPCVLEFMVAREENVYPMVPAGARLDQMIDRLI